MRCYYGKPAFCFIIENFDFYAPLYNSNLQKESFVSVFKNGPSKIFGRQPLKNSI